MVIKTHHAVHSFSTHAFTVHSHVQKQSNAIELWAYTGRCAECVYEQKHTSHRNQNTCAFIVCEPLIHICWYTRTHTHACLHNWFRYFSIRVGASTYVCIWMCMNEKRACVLSINRSSEWSFWIGIENDRYFLLVCVNANLNFYAYRREKNERRKQGAKFSVSRL